MSQPHKFCEVQCAMYPHCQCFKEAEKSANAAMSKLPADTLAQWQTDIDREAGTITFTARDQPKVCLFCNGQKHMYQIEAQLGGDFFHCPPTTMYSQKVNCPACLGSGVQPNN